ncbi:hypothetical protein BJ684DRAFT_15496 [Piptocephalis cylindrospora]|uniref:Uncharacterized protein n=1 Tax=Piptocephalis cylindrospora TaxID=1907219 RepID=A0A4P9Y5E2_9FUNG|nr:hypothetical protein BJ684DRAFT_15496 [Piptocephalis cylindrospora]|eukprot:RKP14163.1 hypothetical protein BJ684DRAFT_15496 [Piptocephalis cylindrospora]
MGNLGWERKNENGWERERGNGWERERENGWERERENGWERERENGRLKRTVEDSEDPQEGVWDGVWDDEEGFERKRPRSREKIPVDDLEVEDGDTFGEERGEGEDEDSGVVGVGRYGVDLGESKEAWAESWTERCFLISDGGEGGGEEER